MAAGLTRPSTLLSPLGGSHGLISGAECRSCWAVSPSTRLPMVDPRWPLQWVTQGQGVLSLGNTGEDDPSLGNLGAGRAYLMAGLLQLPTAHCHVVSICRWEFRRPALPGRKGPRCLRRHCRLSYPGLSLSSCGLFLS